MKYSQEPLFSKKKNAGICVILHCQNNKVKNRRICYKHIYEKNKMNNPISHTYNVLKCNARRRKKEFELTLEEFEKFCSDNDYIEKKGRSAYSLTIDRIISTIGYTHDNIQILTNSANVKKMWVESKIRLGRYPTEDELSISLSRPTERDTDEDDCPF